MHNMDNDIDHILVPEEELKAKVTALGEQITRDYEGKDLLMVSILKRLRCLYGGPDACSQDALRH